MARKHRHGFDYVVVDPAGEIGLLTTGAGLSMMLIDELRAAGLKPYNFLDIRTGGLRGYVFCNRAGQPLDHNNFTKRVWYPLLRHLGLKPRRPYQMRHTAATLWLAAGENPEWIARQMGHASTEMLFKVYSRFVPNLTRQDGSAFERIVSAAFQSAPGEGDHHD